MHLKVLLDRVHPIKGFVYESGYLINGQPMDTLRDKNLFEDLWESGQAPRKA